MEITSRFCTNYLSRYLPE